MDTIFDDLAKAVRAPRTDAWTPVRALTLDIGGG